MKLFGISREAGLSIAALCAALVFCARPAHAAASFDIGFGVAPSRPAIVAEGHYETRTERILVSPERHERQRIEAVYETHYLNGRPQTVCVNPGGWREFIVPAQYENRIVQVWVPGYATYYPRYVAPAFGFDFNYRNRH